MSENIAQVPGLIVTRFIGPADLGPDRRLYQFTDYRTAQAWSIDHAALDGLVRQLATYLGLTVVD